MHDPVSGLLAKRRPDHQCLADRYESSLRQGSSEPRAGQSRGSEVSYRSQSDHQTRPVCIAELGAMWARALDLFSIAAPGMAIADMKGVLKGVAVRYLDEEESFDELRRTVRRTPDFRPN